MLMDIDKDIIKQTKCKKDFKCLDGPANIDCKVLCLIGGDHHYVSCSNYAPCEYMTNFAGSDICNCPTRKEIYRKYKK